MSQSSANPQSAIRNPQSPVWASRRGVKLALLLASLAFALVVCEVALRLVGYSFPTFYTTDEMRGFALRPGAEGWYRKEGESYVRVNSQGLRDREHARAKPPGTLRIAVVGDSYAEALQVAPEQAFWRVLEAELQRCPALAGRAVEAINFGVSGYSTAQQLITVEQQVFDYSPDIVLLAFTTNNDVTDNSRALKRMDEMPYFVLRDGRLALDDSFRRSRAFRLRQSAPARLAVWIRDNSRVLQAFHHAHYAFKSYLARRRAPPPPQPPTGDARPAQPPAPTASQSPWSSPMQSPSPSLASPSASSSASSSSAPSSPASSQTPAPVVNADEVGIDNLVYSEPREEVWREAWLVTEALVVRMRDEVERRGARFVVATLSNGIQVHPDAHARAAFMRRVGATDLFYPDLRVRALGERAGFAVFNLAPELQAHAERNRVFLHGFGADIGNGHWNAEGHRVAGQLLAQKLCAATAKP